MERFNELMTTINEAQVDAVKFYEKKNKAAGTRLRRHMQKVKELAQRVRFEVSNIKSQK